jgi:hypothetical protein
MNDTTPKYLKYPSTTEHALRTGLKPNINAAEF